MASAVSPAPTPRKKRLVVCADGTWNEPAEVDDGKPAATNVAKLAVAVAPIDADGVCQVVFYHAGVGERGGLWDHYGGGAFGDGISRNILDLYASLVTNYAPGDEIWLFGFSRGAYTVRSLGGLVRHCGLLRRENLREMFRAYAIYRDRPQTQVRGLTKEQRIHPDSAQKKKFRADFSWPNFKFRFIGVWDTVGALGIPLRWFDVFNRKYQFHDVKLGKDVELAYHALALDERRGPFKPAIWEQEHPAPPGQVLQQAWFPGVHRNVGGGFRDPGLSNGALAWIWHKASAAGLALNPQLLSAGDAGAVSEDSLTLFYKLLRPKVRIPGERAHGQEGAHASIFERQKRMSDYKPTNLEAFLGRKPVPPTYDP